MDRLQMAEMLVNKCGITYEEAAAVLEQSGYDMLEAMILLERQGRIRGGGYSGRKISFGSRRRASDANTMGEFMSTFWRELIGGARLLFMSRLVINTGKKDAKIPLFLGLLILLIGNIPAAIVAVITMACGCRYTIEVRQ